MADAQLFISDLRCYRNRDEEQMSQNTNSNSASVIVAGPTGVTGVTGTRVIKFRYKEFPGCRV